MKGKQTETTKKIAQMTLAEKASLVCGGGSFRTAAIDRLGIPSVLMADGPVGVRLERKNASAERMAGVPEMYRTYPATCLPSTANLANTFDRSLARACGEMLGRQCRALGVGMLLAPGVNLKRDVLCGRNFEYYSEDPYLTGELASEFVRGIQGTGVAACVKHYACNNRENGRLISDSVLDERTLRELYLEPFERVIRGARPAAVMAAYNRVNGEYCCRNRHLLRDILRREWGFEGIVVSDWGAVDGRSECLEAGLDLEMPDSLGEGVRAIESAGETPALNESCRRVAAFAEQYALPQDPDPSIPAEELRRGHALAVRAAQESMVLLKNDELLPLAPEGRDTVFAGVMLDRPRIQGAGSAKVNAAEVIAPRDTLGARFPGARFFVGFDEKGRREKDWGSLLAACREAQTVVLLFGIPETEESEGFDRSSYSLPEALRERVSEIAETCGRMVFVVCGGGAADLEIGPCGALLWAGLAGEGFGEALAGILSGDCNPSGRLSETFPRRREDGCASLACGKEVLYGEGLMIGYRWFDAKKIAPAYPFGAGLSYTEFRYESLICRKDPSGGIVAEVRLRNTGKRAGKETILCFVSKPADRAVVPIRQLAGFGKYWLEPGECITAEILLDGRAFCRFDELTGGFVRDCGSFVVSVGRDASETLLSAQTELPGGGGGRLRYHRNMTFREIQNSEGKGSLDALVKDFQRVSGSSLDPRTTEDELVRRIIWDHPLRALISLYAGKYTLADLDRYIAQKNGERR